MRYTPIVDATMLPTEGQLLDDVREKQDLDFKESADPVKPFEHAKDLAALANAWGGTLLVGAKEDEGPPAKLEYTGVRPDQTSAGIKTTYETAAKHCEPPLSPDVYILRTISGKEVVAVNVAPSVPLVAVPGCFKDPNPNAPKGRQLRLDDTWRFPTRTASHTTFIKPRDLAKHMNVARRELLLRLYAITAGNEVQLQYHGVSGGSKYGNIVVMTCKGAPRLKAIDDADNYIDIEVGDSPTHCARIPLDDVLKVWLVRAGLHAILVHGTVEGTPASIKYVPLKH